MSNSDKNKLSFQTIKYADTISQFMEKVNNNFEKIIESNGGPAGVKGDDGDQGVPTKPKVPIHVWAQNEHYNSEYSEGGTFRLDLNGYENELTDVKYQEGHLILLQNAHVYILEVNNDFTLYPRFLLSFQSYNSGDVVDGRPTYVHFAYSKNPDGEGLQTDQELKDNNINQINMPYMGVCSNHNESSPKVKEAYSWMRIQGADGKDGVDGEDGKDGKDGVDGEDGKDGKDGVDGENGDNFTGHSYTIDLEGDMSTISIRSDGTRQYDDDYCFCKAHAYYGDENVFLPVSDVSVKLPSGYSYEDQTKIVDEKNNTVGVITKEQDGNDVSIKFIPDENFIFPKKTILFTIHVETTINDEDDGNKYKFTRDLVWMVKGIVSTFELEIMPQYRVIKLFDDGQYFPKKLLVTVYKVEDVERDVFDFSQNTDFTLLYKNLDNKNWNIYPDEGVETEGVSCLEFKVVRYHETENEEIWDYEDVWVVADGKSVHYYHADLGNAESMMVLTTGEVKNEGTEDDPIYCAELRNESGYSITFEPKFYDGTTELEVAEVNIGSINGEEYTKAGSFEYELGKLTEVEEVNGIKRYQITFKITKVPYNVDMIPMTFDVLGKYPTYDNFGNITGEEYKNDTVSFNVYISTLSSLYTLVPTVSAYNTSTGKDGDKIGCDVYKNDVLIETTDLNQNALLLEYIVFDSGTEPNIYSEPLIYGEDSDIVKDDFTAEDVAIVFILSYRGNEVARSTVPLIKDGIDGRDGDSWQYIFCRSSVYPFEDTHISNPNTWTEDPNKENPSKEYLGEEEDGYSEVEPNKRWYDDHKGVDSKYRYEYQSYRKWDKDKKCWGTYGSPTLYSNYSESGSGYSVLLSNPVAVIPVGDDWAVDENNPNQYDSTLVYLYNNTSDISSNDNVTISLPDKEEINRHFTTDKDENGINRITFTPVVDGEYFEFSKGAQYKLPITLTYNLGEDSDSDVDHFTSTINWTLSPIKGLEDFEVFVDKRVVNTSVSSTHTLRVGYYLITSNGGRKFIGKYDDKENANGYKIILTDDIEELTNVVDNWQNATYDFDYDNGENRNCYVVLVDSNGDSDSDGDSDGVTIIDYTNVISVNDGNDGSGVNSAIHLELTQDYISVPSNNNGGVHSNYNDPITSTLLLYSGDKLIEYEKITYSIKIDGEEPSEITKEKDPNNNGCKFTIPNNLISGDTNVECIATYNDISYYKTLFIDLELTPYELVLNTNILTKNLTGDDNAGKIVEPTLTAVVIYWDGNQWKPYENGNLYVVLPNGTKKEFSAPSPDENGLNGYSLTRKFNIADDDDLGGDNVKHTEVRISFQENGKELSYETIGIISHGKNGEDGKSGSGYSVILSNPVAIIPVGADSETNDNNEIQKDFTYVYFYDNTSDISTNINIGVSIDENDDRCKFFEAKRDENNSIWKVSFNPSYIENDEEDYFNFDADSPFNLPITVTYTIGGDTNSDIDNTNDFFETKIFWTLKPLHNEHNIIEDVEVFVDKTVVNITSTKQHSFRVGYYLSKNGYKKFIEDKDVDNIKKYDIILTDNIDNIDNILSDSEELDVEENWQNVTFTFTDNRNCYVVLVDESKNMIDYGVITSVFDGSDGKSPIHLELSQDYIVLPSDETGQYIHEYYKKSDGVYEGGKKITSIKMTLYNGDEEIPNDDVEFKMVYDNYQIYAPFQKESGYFDVYYIEINPIINSTIHCVATYNGVDYTRDLIIRLTKTPYELEINKGILKRDKTGKIIKTYDDETLKVAVKSWIWVVTENKYEWVYTPSGTVYAKGNKSGKRVELDNIDTNYTNKNERKFKLKEFDGTDDTEIKIYLENYNNEEYSYEYIGIVQDGNDGIGTHLELTQDHILLPSEPAYEDGTTIYYKVHSSYSESIQTQMILYSGDQIITSGIVYSFIVNEIPIEKDDTRISVNKTVGDQYGTITFSPDLIKDDTNIKCTATYNGVSYHKVLFVDLEVTPYEMEIDKNILRRDVNANSGSGLIIDNDITVHVKYWKDGNWFYTHSGVVYFESSYDPNLNKTFDIKNEIPEDLSLSNGYERTLTLTDAIKKSKSPEFRIYYKNSNDIEVSSETLGVINSGKDGQDGEDGTTSKCISSVIIGYALPINDSCPDITKLTEENESEYVGENKVWKPSIQYLYGDKTANEMVGTQIYILLKEEWKKENSNEKSFFIYRTTVTLAGTQGIDGKSRVLFYLGSYYKGTPLKPETPTLSESIPTVFNDIRCDYYIDNSGNAWMRKGTPTNGTETGDSAICTIPNGFDSSNENWEASTKVGFLQAGAITAEMINTDSLMADNAFISGLKTIKLTAENLCVNAGNIVGTLTVGNTDKDKIKTSDIIKGINGPRSTNTTTIDGGKITTGTITASHIKTGAITADMISGDTIKGKTIKSSEDISETITDATWQINNNGSGWLANKNIEWTSDGKITLKGNTHIEGGTTIGDGAWTVTSKGIQSINNIAEFNNDGSGQIGGYSDKNLTINKGISWSNSGKLTFHNVQFFNYEEYTPEYFDDDVKLPNIDINTLNKIIISNPTEQPSSNNKYITLYLSNLFKDIKSDTVSDIDIINNSDYPIMVKSLWTNNYDIIVPQIKNNFDQNPWLNIERVTLTSSDTARIYILPSTYLGITIVAKKENKNGNIFIRNISDFMYSDFYKEEESGTVISKCLISKTPFFNNLPLSYTQIYKDIYNISKKYNLNIIIHNDIDKDYYEVKVANKISHNTANGISSSILEWKTIDEYESHTINLLVDLSNTYDPYFNYLNNIIKYNKKIDTTQNIKIIIYINSFNIKFECNINNKNLKLETEYDFSFKDNIFKAGFKEKEEKYNGIYNIIKNLLKQSSNATMDMVIYLVNIGNTQQNAPAPPSIEEGDF